MKVNLNQAINSANIQDFNSLGTKSSYFGSKKLLSYSYSKGWKVKEYNFLQLFFRKTFHSYKNTHLNHVAHHLNEAREENTPPDQLLERISNLWQKTYPYSPQAIKRPFTRSDIAEESDAIETPDTPVSDFPHIAEEPSDLEKPPNRVPTEKPNDAVSSDASNSKASKSHTHSKHKSRAVSDEDAGNSKVTNNQELNVKPHEEPKSIAQATSLPSTDEEPAKDTTKKSVRNAQQAPASQAKASQKPHSQTYRLSGAKRDILDLVESQEGDVAKGLMALSEDYNYYAIPGDNHCLFRSIAFAVLLALEKGKHQGVPELHGKIDYTLQTIGASETLRKYATFFKNCTRHKDVESIALLKDPKISDQLVQFLRLLSYEYNKKFTDQNKEFYGRQDITYDEYLSKIKVMRHKEMGGHLEIQALANALGLGVTILDAEGIGKGGSVNQEHYHHQGKDVIIRIDLLFLPLHYNVAVTSGMREID